MLPHNAKLEKPPFLLACLLRFRITTPQITINTYYSHTIMRHVRAQQEADV